MSYETSRLMTQAFAAVQTRDWDGAEHNLVELLMLDPSSVPALRLRSVLRNRAGDRQYAVDLLESALYFDPENVGTLRDLARTWSEMGRCHEAIEALRKAKRARPDDPQCDYDLGFALLHGERYGEGWDVFEARVPATMAQLGMHPLPPNCWDGRRVDGTLGIVNEGGYGDMMQFARFLPDLVPFAQRIVVRAPNQLTRLFRHAFRAWPQITFEDASAWTQCDAWCPIMSLPHRLKITGDFWRGLYLGDWAPLDQRKKRVGFAWRGSPKHPRDGERSLTPAALSELISFRHDRLTWCCLQDGPPREQLAAVSKDRPDLFMPSAFRDWWETSRFVRSLDAVITVDTAVAHLAGSMGVPVLLMHCTAPEWRWPGIAERSPWYPSVKIARQHKPMNWDEVIAQAHLFLHDRLA